MSPMIKLLIGILSSLFVPRARCMLGTHSNAHSDTSAGTCGSHSGSDALLVKAEPEDPVCHTGNRTCFFTPLWEAEARS